MGTGGRGECGADRNRGRREAGPQRHPIADHELGHVVELDDVGGWAGPGDDVLEQASEPVGGAARGHQFARQPEATLQGGGKRGTADRHRGTQHEQRQGNGREDPRQVVEKAKGVCFRGAHVAAAGDERRQPQQRQGDNQAHEIARVPSPSHVKRVISVSRVASGDAARQATAGPIRLRPFGLGGPGSAGARAATRLTTRRRSGLRT